MKLYIYKTTNNINGKIYIGKCEKDVNESNYYLGSGTILVKAIAKYGNENFTKEILVEVEDRQLLNTLEIYFIDYYKEIFNDQCYNIAKGGKGGNNHYYKTDEEKIEFSKKMSELASGEKNGFYGKSHDEKTKKLCGEANIGRKLSEEHKETLRQMMIGNQLNTGRKYSEERKRKTSEQTSGENNPMYGKNHSEETIELISNNIKESKKAKILCEYCGKSSDKGNYNRWHGDNCKKNPGITEEQILKRSPWNKKGPETIPKGSTTK